jgi:hypothetical protein
MMARLPGRTICAAIANARADDDGDDERACFQLQNVEEDINGLSRPGMSASPQRPQAHI